MTTTELPLIEFTAHDRCDRCGSQAYTLARSEFGELLFCVHHSKDYRESLFDDGWEIIDDAQGLVELGYELPELV